MADSKENKVRLSRMINDHPALRLSERTPKEDLDLCGLLMQYYAFDRQLDRQTRMVEKEELTLTDTEEKLLADRRKTTFDNLSFMEAYRAALQGFNPEAGDFLGYFHTLYVRALNRTIEQQHQQQENRILSIGEKKARQIKSLMTLLSQTGRYSAASVPQALYGEYAKRLKISEPVFRELLQLAMEMNGVADLDLQDEEGSEMGSVLSQAADPAAARAMLESERIDSLCAMLELLTDIDQREYPRLFLTNELVGTLKDDRLAEPDRMDYAKAMVQKEELLWQRILEACYLKFVYEPEPEPDSVGHLIQGKLCRRLCNETIAQYKQVSPSAVSQNAKRFWGKLRSEKSHRLLELLGDV